MYTGNTRRSQSANFFNPKAKQAEEENCCMAGRKCDELIPALLV